jgi:hypothetical protein
MNENLQGFVRVWDMDPALRDYVQCAENLGYVGYGMVACNLRLERRHPTR